MNKFVWVSYYLLEEQLKSVIKVTHHNNWITSNQSAFESQSIMSVSSLLHIFLTTRSPKALSGSGHFVSAADYETSNEGNPRCLTKAKASLFF